MTIRKIAFSAVIAAAYSAVTILLAPISYGPLQFRVSEALCVLPFFFPFSVWGLFVGCIIANLVSAYGFIDIVFGSLATLLAALCTMRLGQSRHSGGVVVKALSCLPPVIFNGVIIGAVIAWSGSPDVFWVSFAIYGLQIALGEFVVLFALGLPLLILLPKMQWFRGLSA